MQPLYGEVTGPVRLSHPVIIGQRQQPAKRPVRVEKFHTL
jgi:hypothetical protein